MVCRVLLKWFIPVVLWLILPLTVSAELMRYTGHVDGQEGMACCCQNRTVGVMPSAQGLSDGGCPMQATRERRAFVRACQCLTRDRKFPTVALASAAFENLSVKVRRVLIPKHSQNLYVTSRPTLPEICSYLI